MATPRNPSREWCLLPHSLCQRANRLRACTRTGSLAVANFPGFWTTRKSASSCLARRLTTSGIACSAPLWPVNLHDFHVMCLPKVLFFSSGLLSRAALRCRPQASVVFSGVMSRPPAQCPERRVQQSPSLRHVFPPQVVDREFGLPPVVVQVFVGIVGILSML